MAVAAFFGPRRRERRVFRERVDVLAALSDRDVIARYRLDRQSISDLADLLTDDLSSQTGRNNALSVMTKVLIGLRCLCKGDFYSEVADIHGCSKPTVGRVFDEFLRAVNRRLNNIRFPIAREELIIKQGFYRVGGLGNIIGAIDGTLIPIIAPKDHEEVYVCRKGYHALNIQAVVDHKMRFRDVVAKWPGSCHDAGVFNTCGLKNYLETHRVGTLLGDSGYPLRSYLLTPKLRATTQAEIHYNGIHSRTRMVVERAFGILKSRFRCLHQTGGCLPFKPAKCGNIVMACMRLHNLCVDNNIPAPEILEEVEEDVNNDIIDENVNAQAMRQRIIDML